MSVTKHPRGARRLVARAGVALVVFGVVWYLTENAFVALGVATLVLAPAALNHTPPDA